jgi:outer membrane protein
MQQKIKSWCAVVVVGGWGLLQAHAADTRIVFANMDRIFGEFYKTKLADTQLRDQAGQVMDERKKLMGDFEKLQQEFNKLRDDAQNTALNEDVRTQRRTAAEEKLVEVRDFESKIRRFDETRGKQMKDQQQRMRKRIVEEIRETIQAYARNQMYSAVLDTSGLTANGVEAVLYVEPRVDITGELVDVLNRGRPADAAEKAGAKPAPKGGEAKADAKTEKQAEKK